LELNPASLRNKLVFITLNHSKIKFKLIKQNFPKPADFSKINFEVKMFNFEL